ncbi:MAG TPA: bifunctional 3,4-dihydroxy-2-butanone-4-phosphate synthase/GTP cyclohydrolase II [Verrucomicrobiales bacterium]|jgi:3,4-dihydroxy 2-butanone 4-phosphate synthase/GTP cyclohydrolase II|nr:bifunctional 3,4-dihydroxy-2-butanone-4-phosphate synthase/GTP cyclohydrolase II [Verrucomicrobiales bacterium]
MAEETQDGFDSVEDVIADIRNGKLVIVTDDEDRENEGDLIGAAEMITPALVNFMITEGRGMLCAPVSMEIAERLKLGPMVAQNRDAFRTNYTVTVDAARGVTTGVSAQDRAATIRILADPTSEATDLVQPGHVNPLVARPGGVLRRAGHTEASVDLARLAGLREAGVLIEVLSTDGNPMRLPELRPFAKKHGLKLTSIAALIEYRRRSERLVTREQTIRLPTDWGDFQLYLYQSTLDGREHLALVMGEVNDGEPVLVRVHSECLTGDVFGSRRCDCGWQLDAAMQRIATEGRGVLLYMRQEGRGIGLTAKIHAYKLQEEGLDTVEANLKLGFPMDLRDYGIGAQMLHDLGVRKLRLMTNNPRKIVGLEGHSLEIVEQVPIQPSPNPHNTRYLDTKRLKMGHTL